MAPTCETWVRFCQATGEPGQIVKLTVKGTILLCAAAVFISIYLLYRSERKEAAVGRRWAGPRFFRAPDEHRADSMAERSNSS